MRNLKVLEVSVYPLYNTPAIAGDRINWLADWSNALGIEVSFMDIGDEETPPGFIKKETLTQELLDEFRQCNENKKKGLDELQEYLDHNKDLIKVYE